jgi:predicted lipoprotein with Yx(FWY)xxD motif
MTLYISDKDTPGKSNCDAACVTSWPAVLAAPTAQPSGKFTIVSRADGGKQWAYDGKPLYQSKSDVKAGDKTGDGAAGTWHTAVIVP